MPDNPQTTPDREFRLPDHDVLSITGRDATAFAQAQFMNDVAALPNGHWQWNGWLTPKGRVIALFALLKFDAEKLWLLLPDVDAGELASKLKRYVFRSKVELEPLQGCIEGGFEPSTAANGSAFAVFEGGEVELDMSGEGGPRRLQICWVPPPDDIDLASRWDAADLAHGLPRLPASQAEQWTPQQLSLDRLRAFSIKKGCYPGQEIVARTHFLGQAKRGLALFDAGSPLAGGDEVRDDARAIGSIVSVAGTTSLAVLPLERDDAALTAAGIALREHPLLGGLAR